jgi:cell division protein FtsQ
MTASTLLTEPETVPQSPPPRRRGRLVRRLLWGAAAAVLLLVVTGWVLFFSPWLDLRTVAVEGRGQIPESAILAAAALSDRTPLASLDTGAAAGRVADLPAVAEVRITRNWPNGVTIAVTPRTPVAYAATPEGPVLVDRAGVRYEPVQEAPADLPQLQASDGQPMQDAVAVAATLQSPLRDRVSSVVVANDRIRLTLRGDDEESDGQTGEDQTGDRQSTDGQSTDLTGTAGEVDESGGLVYWGTVEDSELKAKVLAGLLVGGGDYKFFDVATPGYPTAGPSVPDATARVMGLPQDNGQSTSGSSETSEASAATTG